MKLTHTKLFGLASLLVLAVATGCGSSENDNPDATTDSGPGDQGPGDQGPGDPGPGDQGPGDTPGTPKAQVRAIHLSPDAPAVDLFVNDGAAAAASGLEFAKSTGYLSVDAGTYDFDIAPAGQPASASVLAVEDLALEGGKSYTAAAFGPLASIQALALVDAVDGIPEGKFRVRAIHAAAGVGKVDVWALGETPAKIYSQVDFGQAGDPLDLAAGAYTIGFDVDADATPDLVFETPELPAGLFINLFAVKQGEAVFLVAQLPDGTTARIDPKAAPVAKAQVRAIHLSPDAPAVDLFANDGATAAASGLEFAKSTGYLELDAGTYDFDIAPAGQPASASVLAVEDLALEGGKSYTAAAIGPLASIQALALVDAVDGIPEGQLRVRAIHAAAAVGTVDIWVVSETPAKIYSQVGYGQVGDALDVPAGAYLLGFDVNADATPDLLFQTPELPAGAYINLFAVNQGADVFLIAQLPDGSTARIDPAPAK